jgi:D-amino peptidase
MKVFVSVDMEGISGIVHNQEVNPGHARWSECRSLITGDTNAAIEGLLEAGATAIVVNESHGSMRNLLPEQLNPAATLIRGFHKSQCMVEGLDWTFDAAVFVGYHARAGKSAVLSHTISGKNFWDVRINGRQMGETAFNALIAAAHNVPVIMVSGDNVLCDEVRADLGDEVVAVQTKRAIDRYSAECLHPTVSQAHIREGARRALANLGRVKPAAVPEEITLDLTLAGDSMAWAVSCFPGVRRVEERTVRYVTRDPMTLYPFMVAAYLASAGVNQTEAL